MFDKFIRLINPNISTTHETTSSIPSVEDVAQVIEDSISFKSTVLRESITYDSKENKVQRSIAKQLKDIYGSDMIDTEYSIGGHKGMRCDIDIANGAVGLELKVAEQLKSASNIERLVGQVVYDCWCRYKHNNFIVVVVGKEKENDAAMKELADIIHSLGAKFIFKTVI